MACMSPFGILCCLGGIWGIPIGLFVMYIFASFMYDIEQGNVRPYPR